MERLLSRSHTNLRGRLCQLIYLYNKIHLSALLEDITVALVVVAGSAGLAVHVRHVVRRELPLEGGDAGGEGVPGQLAAQLTGLGVTVPLTLGTLTRLQTVGEANGPCALLRIDDINTPPDINNPALPLGSRQTPGCRLSCWA